MSKPTDSELQIHRILMCPAECPAVTESDTLTVRLLKDLCHATAPGKGDGNAKERDILEQAAKICEQHAHEKWKEYKTGHGVTRGDPYWEGQADAADWCANAIRALIPTNPDSLAPSGVERTREEEL